MTVLGPPQSLKVAVDSCPHNSGALKALLTDLVSEGFPSGLSLAIVGPEAIMFSAYGGVACRDDEMRAITEATSYDLASLTKVVCTVTLTLVLEGQGKLSMDDPVQTWLAGFPRSDVTLRHLLTHTSGLVAHRPFFETLTGRAGIEAAVFDEAAGRGPSGEVLYSDLNFMLLGWVLEACSGARLDDLFADDVASRLEMKRTGFRPGPLEETAATELDGDQRLVPGLIQGEVHDGNCYALGCVAGHAGLFAPLDELAIFLRHLLAPDGRVLTAGMLEAMSTRQAGDRPEVRALGWRLAPEGWGGWPEDTLWHTGFTGTSLLVSRPLGLGVILLTNAIHPHRRLDEQAEMRAMIHRQVWEIFN